MGRYVCVHGHFYQPPRENPWLEEVELEDSAYPYHDWNERITAECYAPNAASRILDSEGRIESIVNNYASMSFNFGPTLLSWLERHASEVYEKLLEADRESVERFSGHGNALAQVYNHMLLPLAQPRDVRTQVLWGLEDFRRRFEREPEGMWLPETAVSTVTLEVLADFGVRFTILAPHQAVRVRRLNGGWWRDVQGEQVDPTRPYLARLPSGRSLAVFFYDGPISRGVAFEGLLSRGDRLAERVAGAFHDGHRHPQLVHAATDGESYGHHHRHGDMALAYALQQLAAWGVTITNYGEHLERHPPTHEVEVLENSSWSCAHGVERWRSDCGCHSGRHPDWNQEWRAPLRQAFDELRAELDVRYEERARELLADPWAARDGFIQVVLDRDPASVRRFLDSHRAREIGPKDVVTALKLLEMQRHAMLMYTSCGWFFDDLAGLETVQVMRYAGRAVQLAQELFGDDVEQRFEVALAKARSNVPREGDGREIYRRRVLPYAVDLAQVAAHYAVSSVFGEEKRPRAVYSYYVESEEQRRWPTGGATLEVGRVKVSSEITWDSARLCYGALHLGGHNLAAGVRPSAQGDEAEELAQQVAEAIRQADLPETLRILDRHFQGATYSFKSLFRDERRRLVNRILESTLVDVETAFRQAFQQHAPSMQFLVDSRVPIPKALRAVAELSFEADLRGALESEEDLSRVRELLEQAREWGLNLDEEGLAYAMERALERVAVEVWEDPQYLGALKHFYGLADTALSLGLEVDVHKAQNTCYELLNAQYPQHAEAAGAGDPEAARWLELFGSLANVLHVRVP
ncbi:MAG: DUF3536 domain-containing protein [Candidatus Bipolaricaulota bacterium]